MSATATVKRSIYLDEDLIEPLRASAEAAGRSQTRQLNVLLRNGLGLEQKLSHEGMTTSKRSYEPDPKAGRPRRRST